MNNSSVFTLDRKGNGFDIVEYPKDIYVDTSVWNKIYGSENTSQSKVLLTDFMADCIENNSKFYSSGVVHEELAHIIKEDIIRQEFDRNNYKLHKYPDGAIDIKDRNRQVLSRNPSIKHNITININNAINFVMQSSEFLEYEETEEVMKKMLEIMEKSDYTLDTRDIKHVLVAHMYGINSILTCDGDYAAFENLNVYVPPSEKYSKIKMGRANVLLPFEENKF